MEGTNPIGDDHVDEQVNAEIITCLTADPPRSFFLYAGAGSGKTRALVTALNRLRESQGNRMQLHGQQVAVITYTNAATDEIKRRLDFDPLVTVSTIHSFVWNLIKGFNTDIRQFLKASLAVDITDLQELQRRGKPGTKTALDRERSIASTQQRLALLNEIRTFTYNPNGGNRDRDSLSHAEVIKIGANFLTSKPVMQQILVSGFPILLVDESQDTNKMLMEALFVVERAHREHFRLGLFGDTMQRIFSDGKIDLGKDLPPDWARPALVMNHRCPRRVIRLINKIRADVDGHEQQPRSDMNEGHVRLFVSYGNITDKMRLEEQSRKIMAKTTGDDLWNQPEHVKTLILEHHMAARRMEFFQMFEPLYKTEEFKTGLLDGTLSVARFFSELILPLTRAEEEGSKFGVAAIVRKSSPLLGKSALESAGANQLDQLNAANLALESLMKLWSGDAQPRFIDVLQCVARTRLFEIPDLLRPFAGTEAESTASDEVAVVTVDPDDSRSKSLDALRSFLDTPFAQIKPYSDYVKGEAAFDTHQGVKGLEFPRVLVIIDDEEARGFMFTYEKLFGVKEKTTRDLEQEIAGDETGIDRTRRLFYVTCSRTEKSLAIVSYSSNPEKVKGHAIQQGWFEDNEIEFLK
jgi:DNA helicase-2/ATP-dependent DNA helicase PcrA